MADTSETQPVSSTPVPVTTASEPIAFNTAELGEAAMPAAAMPGVPENDAQEYGFDDESIRQYEFDLYKGRKNVTDRIGVLSLPWGARVHFKTGIGYFQCLSVFQRKVISGQTIEQCTKRAACCVHCDAPRKRFILPMIQYATLPNGQLTPSFGYALKAWLYSDDKYTQMKTINSQFPLLEHDLLLTCTDENFGKYTIAACREAIWLSPKLPSQIKEEVKNWVEAMRPKMAKKIGKKLTETEFLQKAGLAPTPTVVPGMDAPIVDLKELLA